MDFLLLLIGQPGNSFSPTVPLPLVFLLTASVIYLVWHHLGTIVPIMQMFGFVFLCTLPLSYPCYWIKLHG